jgi:hypothetical protein
MVAHLDGRQSVTSAAIRPIPRIRNSSVSASSAECGRSLESQVERFSAASGSRSAGTGELNDFPPQEWIHDLALVVVDCRLPKKMDCADVADAVSSRILYEPREGRSRRQRSDSGRITPHPVFAQGTVVFALRKSRPRGARGCRLQLLLGFCIDLFSDNAVAVRLAETTLPRSSIASSVDSLPPQAHTFGPPGPRASFGSSSLFGSRGR